MIILETSVFTRQVQQALTDDAYRDLQLELVERPDAGAVVRGSGGLRKLRWSGAGRGKRGGLRIIYYWRSLKISSSCSFSIRRVIEMICRRSNSGV